MAGPLWLKPLDLATFALRPADCVIAAALVFLLFAGYALLVSADAFSGPTRNGMQAAPQLGETLSSQFTRHCVVISIGLFAGFVILAASLR